MKQKTVIQYLAALILTATCLSSAAQTDTINFSNKQLLTAQLKPGLKQYLVYFQNPAQSKMLNLSLWTRDIKMIQHEGERCYQIIQKWYGNDTLGYRTVNSINRLSDFSPIYHAESVRGQLRAYKWTAQKIVGDKAVVANTQKDFELQFDQPYFNWNLDIETYEMLPLAKGKNFVIPFYDAGSGKPEHITFIVKAEQVLTTLDNKNVDCWVLLTEGSRGALRYTQTYWISKKGHEFLMEEDNYNGMYRYKVKLPAYAPDIISRFKQ